jgi:hypothetical protein
MSYPHQVPEGWIKGEKLKMIGGDGPRFGLIQDMTVEEGFRRLVLEGAATKESIYAVEFDSRADAESFLTWWNTPKG